ncbi:BadF/BadG/BcrA/BcrD ATPase family protein [Agilicoccus flavus]|uniref:BadF/BadG/BcrA/BcrD ATPase family protein n=1 Tax=Agilicoccus flavus TaxID=2775968 RepID=UPI001CF7087F|nr:BadF/BadG/BcrA/BcrD ATPase family protein [Agilicoccus flavus]
MDTPETLELLAVDLGRAGLSARRVTLRRADEFGLAVDPDGTVAAPRLRAGRPVDVEALTDLVAPLAEAGPVDACVWSVADLTATLDAPALLARAAALSGTERTVVVDGSVATLVGAVAEVGPGVVLDMGVGVVALATDFDQTWRRLDGWGSLLGDRGSAAWVGRQGLAAGLLHRDGVPGGSAALLDAGRRSFGDERGWATLAAEHGPGLLADFAPVVGDVASRDDVARDICRLAGEHLADTLCAGAAALPGAPLSATGGLLLVEAVKVAFASALGKRHVFLVPALGSPLDGATILARHLATGHDLTHRPGALHVWGAASLPAAPTGGERASDDVTEDAEAVEGVEIVEGVEVVARP